MDNNTDTKEYIDYFSIIRFIKSKKEELSKYDAVYAIGRGGYVPGVIISYMIDVPLVPVEFSSDKGNGTGKKLQYWDTSTATTNYQNILVVDDIIDKGHTMVEFLTHAQEKGLITQESVDVFSIVCTHSKLLQDYMNSGEGIKIGKLINLVYRPEPLNNWIVFPWES